MFDIITFLQKGVCHIRRYQLLDLLHHQTESINQKYDIRQNLRIFTRVFLGLNWQKIRNIQPGPLFSLKKRA